MNYKIPLSFPVFEGNENTYTNHAISSGHLATFGPFIDKFESKLSKRLQTHGVVALNSGTSALHMAMVLLGIGPGDDVICQSFTFCASANPIRYLGANPVFVDSEMATWNMCPEILEDAILSRMALGKKPKAIVLVHLFGMPAKMEQVMAVAAKYQIPVLEDAAEALGSTLNDKYCGTFGEIGIFSFNGNKVITTGGGGTLISNDANYLQRARYLASQAREDLPYYHHLEIGYNYRLNNLAAAVGVGQLEQLDDFVSKRRRINENYRSLLSDKPGISFQDEQAGSNSNYWLTSIIIDEDITGFSNVELRSLLLRNSIESRFLWKPLHLQPVYQDMPYYGGVNAKRLFSQGLCLPSSANLTIADQEMIVDIIEQLYTKAFK